MAQSEFVNAARMWVREGDIAQQRYFAIIPCRAKQQVSQPALTSRCIAGIYYCGNRETAIRRVIFLVIESIDQVTCTFPVLKRISMPDKKSSRSPGAIC